MDIDNIWVLCSKGDDDTWKEHRFLYNNSNLEMITYHSTREPNRVFVWVLTRSWKEEWIPWFWYKNGKPIEVTHSHPLTASVIEYLKADLV